MPVTCGHFWRALTKIFQNIVTLTGYIGASSYAEQLSVTADGKNVYVKSNVVDIYDRNSTTGVISNHRTIAAGSGSGPAIVTSPDNKNVYTIDNASPYTVYQFNRDTVTGNLTSVTTSLAVTNAGYALTMSPDSAFLYAVTNDNPAVIHSFARDLVTGNLTVTAQGTIIETYSNSVKQCMVSSDNNYLYTVDSNNIVATFSRNTNTGALTAIDHFSAPYTTSSIVVSNDGLSAYIPSFGNALIMEYDRSLTTGLLTYRISITTSPDIRPIWVAMSPDGQSLYSISSGSPYNVLPYSRDSSGVLTQLSPVAVTPGAIPTVLALSPDGSSIYVSAGFSVYYYSRS